MFIKNFLRSLLTSLPYSSDLSCRYSRYFTRERARSEQGRARGRERRDFTRLRSRQVRPGPDTPGIRDAAAADPAEPKPAQRRAPPGPRPGALAGPGSPRSAGTRQSADGDRHTAGVPGTHGAPPPPRARRCDPHLAKVAVLRRLGPRAAAGRQGVCHLPPFVPPLLRAAATLREMSLLPHGAARLRPRRRRGGAAPPRPRPASPAAGEGPPVRVPVWGAARSAGAGAALEAENGRSRHLGEREPETCPRGTALCRILILLAPVLLPFSSVIRKILGECIKLRVK